MFKRLFLPTLALLVGIAAANCDCLDCEQQGSIFKVTPGAHEFSIWGASSPNALIITVTSAYDWTIDPATIPAGCTFSQTKGSAGVTQIRVRPQHYYLTVPPTHLGDVLFLANSGERATVSLTQRFFITSCIEWDGDYQSPAFFEFWGSSSHEFPVNYSIPEARAFTIKVNSSQDWTIPYPPNPEWYQLSVLEGRAGVTYIEVTASGVPNFPDTRPSDPRYDIINFLTDKGDYFQFYLSEDYWIIVDQWNNGGAPFGYLPHTGGTEYVTVSTPNPPWKIGNMGIGNNPNPIYQIPEWFTIKPLPVESADSFSSFEIEVAPNDSPSVRSFFIVIIDSNGKPGAISIHQWGTP